MVLNFAKGIYLFFLITTTLVYTKESSDILTPKLGVKKRGRH